MPHLHFSNLAGTPLETAEIGVRIFCVGHNYQEHAKETGQAAAPEFPNFFTRFASSFVMGDEDIVTPKVSARHDYEGELVVVIGKSGRHIPEASALEHVYGYTVGMDGSVRDWQRRTSQFTLGKNFDKSGAISGKIVPADALPAGAHGLKLQTRLNGELLQDGNTADMVFGVAKLVSTLSTVLEIQPGDLILTGTPAGVGMARDPRVFLKAGDVMEVSIEGIGTLKNRIVAEA
ncbi:MAG: fumarylacetoacetate hydrolase family protein [Alphaproteobacteria bacterium]|nr:fumarylacetoacetate hydrolase family protein [Alphaproteobacteria bacterium]